MWIRSTLGSLLLLACFISTSNAQRDEQLIEYVIGVADAHYASVESWRTGDFLMKMNSVGTGYVLGIPAETSPELIEDSTVYIRIIFDLDQNYFLFVRSVQTDKHLFSPEGEELPIGNLPALNKSHFGAVTDAVSMKTFLSFKPGTLESWSKPIQFFEALGLFSIPDIRSTGILSIGPRRESELRIRLDEMMNTDAIEEVRAVGKNVFRVRSKVKNGANHFFAELDWDLEKMIPTRRAILTDTGRVLTPYVSTDEESIQWSEVHDQLVPVGLRNTEKRVTFANADRFGLEYETEIKIKWFSINEPISIERFNRKSIEDIAKQTAWVDPSLFEDNDEKDPKKK